MNQEDSQDYKPAELLICTALGEGCCQHWDASADESSCVIGH